MLCFSVVVVLDSTYSLYAVINPLMVWPRGDLATPPLEILTIACLTFSLLLTDRPTLGLAEYKLKLSIFVKCTGQGVLNLWCYELFD